MCGRGRTERVPSRCPGVRRGAIVRMMSPCAAPMGDDGAATSAGRSWTGPEGGHGRPAGEPSAGSRATVEECREPLGGRLVADAIEHLTGLAPYLAGRFLVTGPTVGVT